MRIPCPWCGERDSGEFVQRGDAHPQRPADDAGFHDYVYLRENPAGGLDEYWYHAQGCRSWLVVARDTRTHAVEDARLASEARR